MKTNIKLFLVIFFTVILFPFSANASKTKIVYPLQKVSKLQCRYANFSELKDDCLENLPILKTKDYKKYSKKNKWFNKFTRRYSVLWWSSYKYGWDVWHWGHMWVDIATAKWTPIYAIAEWEVIVASWKVWLWKMVAIRHNIWGKIIVSNYGHMSEIIAKKWQKVKAWDLIWKVGSTWNSTWNHLHLQIDTKTKFSPIYYDFKTCPYSYHKISEEGVCFDELEKITLDPLKFLETKWAILNNVKITTTKNNITRKKSSNKTKTITSNSSIFDRTVYKWYSHWDIREVQTIYKSLWYYKWEITWDYRDVEKSVIKYQLEKNIIKSKHDDGAGRFWPKTRAQTRKDWKIFIKNWWKIATTEIIWEKEENNEDNNEKENVVSIKTEKIKKENLLSREEIEKREVEEFLDRFRVELKFENPWESVKKWKIEKLKLRVTDSRWKPFKWNMPWSMTFKFNKKNLKVFPEKLYFFTDWKRKIELTGLTEWTTILEVKIWEITVKKFNIKVYDSKKTIYPETSKFYLPNTSTMWQATRWLAVFKDKNNRNLINIAFGSTFKLKASEWNKVCIKRWNIKDIRKIYKKTCKNSDFKKEIDFTYKDTISWILIFDFQVLNKNAKFEIINNYNNKKMVVKNVGMWLPKWIARNYEYKDEVIESIEIWFTNSSIKRWYFKWDYKLSEAEAYNWIKDSLYIIKKDNSKNNRKIKENIKNIEKEIHKTSKNKKITRWELLALTYKYLIFDDLDKKITINYKDLNEKENYLANTIFDKNNTWKDKFWAKYFRPKSKITKGEWAYLIVKAIENSNKKLLTKK